MCTFLKYHFSQIFKTYFSIFLQLYKNNSNILSPNIKNKTGEIVLFLFYKVQKFKIAIRPGHKDAPHVSRFSPPALLLIHPVVKR